MLFRSALFLSLLTVFPFTSAFADCTSPAGVQGERDYDSTNQVLMLCDGTNWIEWGDGVINVRNPGDCGHGDSPIYDAYTADWWCPVGCTGLGDAHATFGDHCYYRVDTPATWTDAEAACEADGATLATVTSATESSFLNAELGDYSVWIGGYATDAGNTFGWVTGETWSYENWGGTEPNNVNEDCLHMNYPSLPDTTWNDQSCTSTYAYICEK